MINLSRLTSRLFPDRRPEWERTREREFILAANSLKTLSVTDRGGMSIDPEELRDQIVASREQLKVSVRPRRPPRNHNQSGLSKPVYQHSCRREISKFLNRG
jgi:hypothetical protein